MKDHYSALVDAAEREWNSMIDTYSVPYYPHVSVGWDANPRYNVHHENVCHGNTPELVEDAFRRARNFVDAHIDKLKAPLITVNSWNEWTETSYLQPDNVYGYGYLEAVKRVFVDEVNEQSF
jgi:hypothetical protein